MSKLFILLGLLPVVAGVMVRRWFGDRVMRELGTVQLSSSASTLAKRLVNGAALKLKIEPAKRGRLTATELQLPAATAEGKGVREVADACLLAGLAMLARRQPQLPVWRERALKFSWAFPSFTLLVVIFSFVVAKLAAVWCVAILMLSLGLGVMAGLVAVWIEWQAAGMVAKLTEARAIFTREEDRQAVLRAMKAVAAEKALPGFLGKFFRT